MNRWNIGEKIVSRIDALRAEPEPDGRGWPAGVLLRVARPDLDLSSRDARELLACGWGGVLLRCSIAAAVAAAAFGACKCEGKVRWRSLGSWSGASAMSGDWPLETRAAARTLAERSFSTRERVREAEAIRVAFDEDFLRVTGVLIPLPRFLGVVAFPIALLSALDVVLRVLFFVISLPISIAEPFKAFNRVSRFSVVHNPLVKQNNVVNLETK